MLYVGSKLFAVSLNNTDRNYCEGLACFVWARGCHQLVMDLLPHHSQTKGFDAFKWNNKIKGQGKAGGGGQRRPRDASTLTVCKTYMYSSHLYIIAELRPNTIVENPPPPKKGKE